MGGLDWTALPTVLDMLGIDDPEPLIHELIALRDHGREH